MNGKKPVFPVKYHESYRQLGLTKREHIAIEMTKALTIGFYSSELQVMAEIARTWKDKYGSSDTKFIIRDAIEMTDELLKQLEE